MAIISDESEEGENGHSMDESSSMLSSEKLQILSKRHSASNCVGKVSNGAAPEPGDPGKPDGSLFIRCLIGRRLVPEAAQQASA